MPGPAGGTVEGLVVTARVGRGDWMAVLVARSRSKISTRRDELAKA